MPVLAAAQSSEYPQRSLDVSKLFDAAAGIKVNQITNSPFGNQLSYYDIPCYSSPAGRLFYNTIVSIPEGKKGKKNKPGKGSGQRDSAIWGVVSSRLDGADARLLVTRTPATTSTVRADMSHDGKLVTYTRSNADGEGWDLYGFRVGAGRAIEETRITHLNTPLGSTNKVKTSPPTWDARSGKYLCVFSIDQKVYLVHDDGTSPAGGRVPYAAPLTDLADFPSRKEEDPSFHRIRLNPVFPHLLYYRRNGVKDNWVIDLSQARPVSRRITDYAASIHATWSADGSILAGAMNGTWVEWAVSDNTGQLLESFAQREAGPFGHNNRPGVFYGCYSDDGKRLAIATRYDQEPGGSLWLLDRQTGKTAYLCRARYFGPVTAGQPRMRFVDDDRALVFSSDNSAGMDDSLPPQIFVVRPLPHL